MSHSPLDQAALDQLFLQAHTHNAWLDREVPDALLEQLYSLFRMGPTAMNACPARVVFVKSPEAKALLGPAMAEGNRAKTLAAPVAAVIGYDSRFFEQFPTLFPQNPKAVGMFEANPAMAETVALGSGMLQAAYLIVAARALGLDCGPMGGFDKAAVDQAFFAGTTIKSVLVCNLGYGDPSGVRPRNPRLDFAVACRVA